MAPAPQEVDVFSGPHSRMKELVRIYLDKLSSTDFANYTDLRGLLWSLRSTFREFKSHECIENECIMQKLKHRLRFLKVENEAVLKVHSDNRLSEMQCLLEDGCSQTEHCHSATQMMTIGSKLRDALEVFTKDFLPHMQEEEELFQPLLMKYFTYEELKQIRYDVIERHVRHTKYSSDGDKESSEKADKVKEEDEDITGHCVVAGLPSEVLLQIMSYLNPKELCRCAQVNTQWNQLAMDSSLWKNLHPVRWAQDDWRFVIDDDEVEPPDTVENDEDECNRVTVDEDADFDESESSGDSDDKDSYQGNRAVMSIRREAKMLDGIAKYLIPAIGHGVEKLMLSQSKGLNNAVVYKMLANTPNLKYLDLSLTKVSDMAFKGLGKNGSGRQLKHVILSGCTSITDITLKRLAHALAATPPHPKQQTKETIPKMEGRCCSCDSSSKDFCGSVAIDGLSKDKNGRSKPLHMTDETVTSILPFGKHDTCKVLVQQNRRHSGKFLSSTNIFYQNESEIDNGCAKHISSQGLDTDVNRTENGWSILNQFGSSHKTCCSLKLLDNSSESEETVLKSSRLEFLSLAGCYKISDDGLRYLAGNGVLPNLKHLDLSGCANVTSTGLNQLAAVCTGLDHEEFYYCDNIMEGPYADTASGCQNLQCRHLVCCRSGE